MPISLKVLPSDYTIWRSRIINASKSFSFFAQLLFKFVFLKEKKKKRPCKVLPKPEKALC